MNKAIICISSFIFVGLLVSACTFSPDSDPISKVENQAVRARFKEMIASQKECHCCFDGVVKTRFENFFYEGSIDGYLQAMSPSYLKFMALSPLGQPFAVLTSDGKTFRYVDVEKKIEYSGTVAGKTFQRNAPAGFSPEFTYYWVSGKLRPGEVKLALTSREQGGSRYWIELYYDDGRKSMVLFDSSTLHIYHHLVYNEVGDVLLEILYDEYGKESCAVPHSITVTSLKMNSSLHIQLEDLVADVALSRSDFSYPVPAAFKKEVVE